jgi:hypothetical protein
MDLAFKERVFTACKEILAEKVTTLDEEIRQTRQAASEETKSSMGDKYETGRAMLHLTRERLEGQLAQAQKSYSAVLALTPTSVHERVRVGSLVKTDRGIFYISVGIGQVRVDDQTISCISATAPIGRILIDLYSEGSTTFQGKPLSVLAVV